MKSAIKVVALLALSGSGLALAQTYTNPHFDHVIVVIQENRTPDNLFGAATLNPYPANLPTLGAGVDLKISTDTPNNKAWCLGSCFNPKHGNQAWRHQYNNGGTFQACADTADTGACPSSTCDGHAVCIGCDPAAAYTLPSCPQETYVSPDYDKGSFRGASPLLPYFDIAHKYGFANYFFQTNEGPSQPAHEFLLGGTSAPSGSAAQSWYGSYWQDFFAANAEGDHNGCYDQGGDTVRLIKPDRTYEAIQPTPCFDHLTLVDLLENPSAHLTWKYYVDKLYGIWSAPAGIAHLCYGPGWLPGYFPYECAKYSDFSNNVVTPSQTFFKEANLGGSNIVPPGQGTPNCTLANVTWIVPNGVWSDHPGILNGTSTSEELGPDWVAAVVNAVGTATCVDPITQKHPWQNTVILVVWDDWGGFYDHIGAGLGAQPSQTGCFFSPINWGCGYTYGFRVPFLVVSGYTSDGYVSGACGIADKPPCGPQSNVPPYQHDFGSILAFIENNFGLGIGSINSAQCPNPGSTTCSLFADNYYPEQFATTPGPPLGDFFKLWSGSENYDSSLCTPPKKCPKDFEYVQFAGDYDIGYFRNYNGPVLDPDNDAIDPQD